MGKMMEKQAQGRHIIRQQFDSILIKHIERLLGTRLGVGGLPLNLLTVSCLIFLAEQHANEQGKFSTPEERYTNDTLLKELEEVGLGSNTALKDVLGDMFQKDYVHIAESGFISAKDPVLKMARIFDKILPKMPGLSLVAYIAQTIDEAASNRKDIESAVVQFDQTLTLQGLSLRKDCKKPISTLSGKQLDKKNDFSRPSIYHGEKAKNKSTSGNLISSSAAIGKHDIQELSFAAAPSIQDEPDKDSRIITADANAQVPNTSGQEKEDEAIETPVVEDDASAQTEVSEIQERPDVDTRFQNNEHSEKMASASVISESEALIQGSDDPASGTEAHAPEQLKSNAVGGLSPGTEIELKADLETHDSPQDNHDEIIESRINSFEENLAMQCPVCKSGKIIPEKTIKDKTYYKCLNKTCNFISWGKPHHHVCPRCQNPFLIESKKNGVTILTCPRATCRYRQGDLKEATRETTRVVSAVQNASGNAGISKPHRRVVKRRVVRRKK